MLSTWLLVAWLLIGAVSTVRLLENSLTELDIDQATRREGLLGMILVFQSLTFTRNHFHTWPVFGLDAMKQDSNVQSHELEDGRQSSLNQPMFDSKETSRPKSFGHNWVTLHTISEFTWTLLSWARPPSPGFHIPDIAGTVHTPLRMIGMRIAIPLAIDLRPISKLRTDVYSFATSSLRRCA